MADTPLPPPFVTLARTQEDRMPPALGPTGQAYAKRYMPQAAYGMRGMSAGLDLKPVENDPTKKNDPCVRKKDNSMPAPACRVGHTQEDREGPALGPVPSRVGRV